MPLEFVHSRQGNLELLVNNYIYSLIKSSIKRSFLTWKCIRCNVTIQTTSDKPSGDIIGNEKVRHKKHGPSLIDVQIHRGFSKVFRRNNGGRIKSLKPRKPMKIEKYEDDETDSDASISSQPSTKLPLTEPPASTEINTFSCETVVGKVLKLKFRWKIQNFQEKWWDCQLEESLESLRFSLRGDGLDQWYFQLFPRGTTEHPGNLIMYTKLIAQPLSQIPRDFFAGGISMKINFGGIEIPPTPSLLIEKCTEDKFACVLDSKTMNLQKIFPSWCQDGDLFIFVDITAKTSVQIKSDEIFEVQDQWQRKNIFVIFDVGGRRFKANRVHFEEASPILNKLISQQLAQKNSQNIVKILDVKADVFGQIVDFINNCEEFCLKPSLVEEVLVAADIFQLNRLKKICEKRICMDITVENAASALVLAHETKAERLKDEAISFINANLPKVVHTPEYLNMLQLYPKLVAEVLQTFTL